MALSIKDPQTDQLVRELAALTGEPIPLAVKIAVRDRINATRLRARPKEASDLQDIIERGRRRQILDQREPSDILGYDDVGLPR